MSDLRPCFFLCAGKMTRRCSHCSNNGHNSRTCPTRGGVKLFGVRLTDGSCMKKSASMGNLSSHYGSNSSNNASPNNLHNSSSPDHNNHSIPEGYVSDDPAHTSCSSNCRGAAERKKGNPLFKLIWSFLIEFLCFEKWVHVDWICLWILNISYWAWKFLLILVNGFVKC